MYKLLCVRINYKINESLPKFKTSKLPKTALASLIFTRHAFQFTTAFSSISHLFCQQLKKKHLSPYKHLSLPLSYSECCLYGFTRKLHLHAVLAGLSTLKISASAFLIGSLHKETCPMSVALSKNYTWNPSRRPITEFRAFEPNFSTVNTYFPHRRIFFPGWLWWQNGGCCVGSGIVRKKFNKKAEDGDGFINRVG